MTDVSASDAEVEVRELAWRDAVPLIEFRDVRTFELRARRRDGGFEDVETERPEGSTDLESDMQLLAQQSVESLAIRAVLSSETPDIVYCVDMAAVYSKAEPFVMNKVELGGFIDFIALPNLYPYIRQAVHDLSTRLGAPVTLNLLRVGQNRVQLSPNDEG